MDLHFKWLPQCIKIIILLKDIKIKVINDEVWIIY